MAQHYAAVSSVARVLCCASRMTCCRYGRPTASDEEVIAAAKMAHLDEAVARMAQGYNTGEE
jgi:ABC-type transport system involved in Fe-S cluster assembly fused permease/ATPase subunit